MKTRNLSPLDQIITNFDNGLRTLFGKPLSTGRDNPADAQTDIPLNADEQRLSAGLMRVNHAGEVAAQALYQGQALTAKLPRIRDKMQRAALEENDHLNWCSQRLDELDSHTSITNPIWYGGSLAIGIIAGIAGDKWSLGFVAETERQVVQHLDEHLQRLPASDTKSRAIIEQMKIDEAEHATTAVNAGAADLPTPIKKLMAATSKIMTHCANRL